MMDCGSDVFQPSPRCLHAARQLLLQSRVETRRVIEDGGVEGRRRRRRRSVSTAMEGARLEHLMCFVGNARMQEELRAMEEIIAQQSQDVREINIARCKEVLTLSRDVAGLQEQLLGQAAAEGDLLLCEAFPPNRQRQPLPSAPPGALAGSVTAHADGSKALEEELARKDAILQELRKEAAEAETEAAQLSARLAVVQETHEQELRALRGHVPAPSVATVAAEWSGKQYAEGFAELRRVCEQLRGTGDRLLSTLKPSATPPPADLAVWLRVFAEGLDAAAASIPPRQATATVAFAGDTSTRLS